VLGRGANTPVNKVHEKLRIEELEEKYPHHKDRSMRNSAFLLKEGLNKTNFNLLIS
jgi:hypothetical protein